MQRLLLAAWVAPLVCSITIPVRVILLRDPGGAKNYDAPYTEPGGTLPLNSDGTWTFPSGTKGSLGTSITPNDVEDIFRVVNDYYSTTQVRFTVEKIIEAAPAVPCGAATQVCGVDSKCRTYDYLVRYFGRMDKTETTAGREERPAVLSSMFPTEYEKVGMFTMIYMKYMGTTSQGFATTRGQSRRAHCGEWSDKFTAKITRRPTVGGSKEGYTLAYTTAHELGHLFGLGHTPEKSIMGGGGSEFSSGEIATINSFAKINLNKIFGTQSVVGARSLLTDLNDVFELQSMAPRARSLLATYTGSQTSNKVCTATGTRPTPPTPKPTPRPTASGGGPCVDNDSCLAGRPGWGPGYKCASSRQYCTGTYAEDLKCCPFTCNTCGTTQPPKPDPVTYQLVKGKSITGFAATCGGSDNKVYSNIKECETICNACATCIGFVDRSDNSCAFKMKEVLSDSTKDFYRKVAPPRAAAFELERLEFRESADGYGADDVDVDPCDAVDCGTSVCRFGECVQLEANAGRGPSSTAVVLLLIVPLRVLHYMYC